MNLSVSLVPGNDVVFSLSFGIGLTVYLVQVFFSLLAGDIGFSHLIGGSVVFRASLLILISFSKVADLDKKTSFSVSDSWIPSKVSFPLKSGKAKCIFAAVF